MKNVIKAVKKLKLWSKKKKKKKRYEEHCCLWSSSTSTNTCQPSAPPLPSSSSWLEAEYKYGTFLQPPTLEDIATESSPVSSTSYQQYMVSVSQPVYGIPVPVIHTTTTDTSTPKSNGDLLINDLNMASGVFAKSHSEEIEHEGTNYFEVTRILHQEKSKV
ncbi:hypothetical protein VNO77_39512 [Canavalia gladiata]|uniref:Uncharacterized protein n=1 Tax=Canavalia gladiata TaxID=3824 RepID=A0AAN9KCQ4_CANGL